MAKSKKVSSKEESCNLSSCEYSPSIYVDFDDMTEVKGVCVGDTVRILIKGKVRSVEQRESYEDSKKARASISLKDFEADIITNESAIADLLDDEDE